MDSFSRIGVVVEGVFVDFFPTPKVFFKVGTSRVRLFTRDNNSFNSCFGNMPCELLLPLYLIELSSFLEVCLSLLCKAVTLIEAGSSGAYIGL